jgi:hypothetical protein
LHQYLVGIAKPSFLSWCGRIEDFQPRLHNPLQGAIG